jgi:hypothetical protein
VTSGLKVAGTGQTDKRHLHGTAGDNPAVVLQVTTDNGQDCVNPGK